MSRSQERSCDSWRQKCTGRSRRNTQGSCCHHGSGLRGKLQCKLHFHPVNQCRLGKEYTGSIFLLVWHCTLQSRSRTCTGCSWKGQSRKDSRWGTSDTLRSRELKQKNLGTVHRWRIHQRSSGSQCTSGRSQPGDQSQADKTGILSHLSSWSSPLGKNCRPMPLAGWSMCHWGSSCREHCHRVSTRWQRT